jgi:hypothetical protein
MNSDNKTTEQLKTETSPITDPGKFDEFSGIYFSSSIKIFDPNTDEVLVQKRGDN